MDLNAYAHNIAMFMGQSFDYELARATAHPNLLQRPHAPAGMTAALLEGCRHAVKVCVEAFTHPSERYDPFYCLIIIVQ